MTPEESLDNIDEEISGLKNRLMKLMRLKQDHKLEDYVVGRGELQGGRVSPQQEHFVARGRDAVHGQGHTEKLHAGGS